jgi:hypothetical protein
VRSLIRQAKKSWTIHAMDDCTVGQQAMGDLVPTTLTVMAGSVRRRLVHQEKRRKRRAYRC